MTTISGSNVSGGSMWENVQPVTIPTKTIVRTAFVEGGIMHLDGNLLVQQNSDGSVMIYLSNVNVKFVECKHKST